MNSKNQKFVYSVRKSNRKFEICANRVQKFNPERLFLLIILPLSFRKENCYPPLNIYSGFLIAEPFKRFADGIP